jgi:hypothetical protein
MRSSKRDKKKTTAPRDTRKASSSAKSFLHGPEQQRPIQAISRALAELEQSLLYFRDLNTGAGKSSVTSRIKQRRLVLSRAGAEKLHHWPSPLLHWRRNRYWPTGCRGMKMWRRTCFLCCWVRNFRQGKWCVCFLTGTGGRGNIPATTT